MDGFLVLTHFAAAAGGILIGMWLRERHPR